MRKASAISPVTSIDRTLTIFEVLSHSKKGLSNSEVSRKLRLPKSTISYILRTLRQRGYLYKDDRLGKYHLTAKLLSVGSQALRGIGLHDVAVPILQEVVDKTGLAGHLAILDGSEAVYIEKIDKPCVSHYISPSMCVCLSHCVSVSVCVFLSVCVSV